MFEIGKTYKRSEIHDQYGGNRQGGICPSKKYACIFIFTGSGGKQHGYKNQWENKNVFSYTGEGQEGDMELTRGNIALAYHLQSKKTVFLFKYVRRAYVEYEGELELFDFDYFETPDRLGNFRRGIKFFFKRAGIQLYADHKNAEAPLIREPTPNYKLRQPNVTERKGLVTSRVGQGAYRKSILHRWEYQCAVTKFNKEQILIASHIVSWKDATDKERLDVDNGILLSPTYDALFDKHLISFDEKGHIMLGSQIPTSQYQKIGVTGKECIQSLKEGNQNYLEQHRMLLK